MAKKQKTRKQKILSNQRRQDNTTRYALPEQQSHVVLNAPVEKAKPELIKTISINEYQYLYKDLLKTAILTTSIVLAELLIKQLTLFG